MVSNTQLQALLLQLSVEAVRLYAKQSGQIAVPECFIQNYCASALALCGFCTIVESGDWKLLTGKAMTDPNFAGFRIDLAVYDPSPDGNPDNAKLRALVEFKRSIWKVHDDALRTKRLIEIERQGEKEGRAFGFVIACGQSTDQDADLSEARRLSEAKGLGAMSARSFSEALGNGCTFRGLAIGLATESAAESGQQRAS